MQLALEIIAICGDAGSGKDSVAARLVDQHGYHLVRIAEPLWAMLGAAPFIRDDIAALGRDAFKEALYGHSPRHVTGRKILIDAGKALREQIGSEAWLSGLIHKAFDAGHRKLVIPDLRFPEEADELRMLCNSLCIVRVVRPEGNWGADEESRHDETETRNAEISEDWRIANSGTLEELKKDADEIGDSDYYCFGAFIRNARRGAELLKKRQQVRANG